MQIAVNTVEDATCVVAAETNGSQLLSKLAIIAGTAIALPAVAVTAQPAYPGRLFKILSASTTKGPLTRIVIKPSKIPAPPPFAISVILMLAPNVKPTKGINKVTPGAKNSDIFLSRFPIINPTKIGTMTATREIKGTFAIPAAPKIINVKNGPSLIAKKLIAV